MPTDLLTASVCTPSSSQPRLRASVHTARARLGARSPALGVGLLATFSSRRGGARPTKRPGKRRATLLRRPPRASCPLIEILASSSCRPRASAYAPPPPWPSWPPPPPSSSPPPGPSSPSPPPLPPYPLPSSPQPPFSPPPASPQPPSSPPHGPPRPSSWPPRAPSPSPQPPPCGQPQPSPRHASRCGQPQPDGAPQPA